MTAALTLTNAAGTALSLTDCLHFCFEKERYTPYTRLEAVFSGEISADFLPMNARFSLDGQNLHLGAVDTLRMEKNGGTARVHLTSRGFSAQLLQNQMEPGMLTDVTLSSLMSHYDVPNVSFESGVTTSNYLWVLPHTSQWEALVNLSYKLCGAPPYIAGENCVMVSPKAQPTLRAFSQDALLSAGVRHDFTRIISHYHMDDPDGVHDAYSYENPSAAARGIVRHRQLSFDKQYLHNPALALCDRAAFSNRGSFSCFAVYRGYGGEDLSDTMTLSGILPDPARICRLRILGDRARVTTTLEAYVDGFCNPPSA